jgi:uncharacterized protein YaiL (DUF2058 family)
VQNLREQLLKAGLITEDQKSKAETQQDRKGPRRRDDSRAQREPSKNGSSNRETAAGDAQKQDSQKQDAQKQDPQKQDLQKQDAQKQDPQKQDAQKQDAQKQPQPQKPSKKQLAKQPVNRMLDLSDPKMLKILQAIEANRVREETKGDISFHFTLRDGRVRKIYVNQVTSEGLEAGRLAIVEHGEIGRHVIVGAGALSSIREADAEAVRFANS